MNAPEVTDPEVDLNLLMPASGVDIRSVNRHQRRAAGFRGPAFTQPSPVLRRFTRKHAAEVPMTPARTRRQRKAWARIKRQAIKRGLV